MKFRACLFLLIFVLGCLSLEAAVFTSRRVLLPAKDEDISSQVPDVKAKAPKIYGKKADETAVYEEEEAEPLPAVAEEESEEFLAPIIVEEESEEPLIIVEEREAEEEPVIAEPIPQEEERATEEEPLLERRTVYALVALFSFLVCIGFAFALRAYLGAPLSRLLSLLVALSLTLFPAALSTLALGWSELWCSYLLLLLSFFILRARNGSR